MVRAVPDGRAGARGDRRPSTREKITVAKLDVDANPTVARDYQVLSIPTLILFKGGEPVKQIVGAKPKAALLARSVRLPGLINRDAGATDCTRRDVQAIVSRVSGVTGPTRQVTLRAGPTAAGHNGSQ